MNTTHNEGKGVKIPIPNHLYSAADERMRNALLKLNSLRFGMANVDGYFFRANTQLQQDLECSKNVVRATIETLYRSGLLYVKSIGYQSGKRVTNVYRLNFAAMESWEDGKPLTMLNYHAPDFRVTYTNAPQYEVSEHTPQNTVEVEHIQPTLANHWEEVGVEHRNAETVEVRAISSDRMEALARLNRKGQTYYIPKRLLNAADKPIRETLWRLNQLRYAHAAHHGYFGCSYAALAKSLDCDIQEAKARIETLYREGLLEVAPKMYHLADGVRTVTGFRMNLEAMEVWSGKPLTMLDYHAPDFELTYITNPKREAEEKARMEDAAYFAALAKRKEEAKNEMEEFLKRKEKKTKEYFDEVSRAFSKAKEKTTEDYFNVVSRAFNATKTGTALNCN